jgi:hypothetical protein
MATCRTTGTSGTVIGGGSILGAYMASTGATAGTTAATTINTTTAQTIELTAQCGGTGTSITIQVAAIAVVVP